MTTIKYGSALGLSLLGGGGYYYYKSKAACATAPKPIVEVYIWKFRPSLDKNQFAYGHASMYVRDSRQRESYISWWPDYPRIPKSYLPIVYDAYPVRDQTHQQVVDLEGEKPDHTIVVTGLDEVKIIDYWESLSLQSQGQRAPGPLLPWSALNLNCSTVVANALIAVGADKIAMMYWFRKYWTPNRVLDFSQNIKHEVATKGHL